MTSEHRPMCRGWAPDSPGPIEPLIPLEAVTPGSLCGWIDRLFSFPGFINTAAPQRTLLMRACMGESTKGFHLLLLQPGKPRVPAYNGVTGWSCLGLCGCLRVVCCFFSPRVRKGSAAAREFTMWGSLRTLGITHQVEKTCLMDKTWKRMSEFWLRNYVQIECTFHHIWSIKSYQIPTWAVEITNWC